MTQADYDASALRPIFVKHFELTQDSAAKEAHAFSRIWSIAKTFESLEHDARRPQDEKKSLVKAANNIRLAKERILELGWYGQHAMPNLQELLGIDTPQAHGWSPLTGPKQKISEMTEFLERLSRALRAAETAVDPKAAPPMSALSDEDETLHFRGKGQPRRIAKAILADEAAEAFLRISGDFPTFSIDRISGEAMGSFHPFLCEIFSALKIAGNERDLADAACKKLRARRK